MNFEYYKKYVHDIPELVLKLYPKCTDNTQKLTLWKIAIEQKFDLIDLFPQELGTPEFWNFLAWTTKYEPDLIKVFDIGINHIPMSHKQKLEIYHQMINLNPNNIVLVPKEFLNLEIYVMTFVSIIKSKFGEFNENEISNYELYSLDNNISTIFRMFTQLIPSNTQFNVDLWKNVFLVIPKNLFYIIYMLINYISQRQQQDGPTPFIDELYTFIVSTSRTKPYFIKNISHIIIQSRYKNRDIFAIIRKHFPKLRNCIVSTNSLFREFIQTDFTYLYLIEKNKINKYDHIISWIAIHFGFERIKELISHLYPIKNIESLCILQHICENIIQCRTNFYRGFLCPPNSELLLDVSDVILDYI